MLKKIEGTEVLGGWEFWWLLRESEQPRETRKLRWKPEMRQDRFSKDDDLLSRDVHDAVVQREQEQEGKEEAGAGEEMPDVVVVVHVQEDALWKEKGC